MVTSTTTPNYWKEEAMKNNQLLNNYYDSCNALLEAFCKKHYFDYEDARQSWVAGCVGEIVCCGDYYFNMKLKKSGNIKRLWKTPKSNWMNVSVNIRKEDFSNDHP